MPTKRFSPQPFQNAQAQRQTKSSHVGISAKLLTDKSELRIGAIAKKAGVGVQTLHYYERIGLLPKPARTASNYRLYSVDAVRRVRFIKKAQAVGFTLEEIRQILDIKNHGKAPCRKVAELGEKHLREIDARLADLRRYRRAVVQSLGSWREKTAHRRNCAGEFCDLIERLP